MSYYLCGQTGIENRGCEAIVRSTIKVLNVKKGSIYLATSSPHSDLELTKKLGINMISYNEYPSKIHRYVTSIIRRMFHIDLEGYFRQAELFAHLKEEDLCINIGGDIYCYETPTRCLQLNNYTQKHKIDNILWCASINKESITSEVLKDLNKYKYILAREQLTYDNLLSVGIDQSKIIQCCDPAFFLDVEPVSLPEKFEINNTVGINVSELVVKGENSIVYENILYLINRLLKDTKYKVCLIPHVYNIEKNTCDWKILKKIKDEFSSDRVILIDKEFNCQQLKYIISNLKFMIAARTHASIAAYSSCVPTLVLGYSVKSKGIATDLFGTDEKYVLSYDSILDKCDLWNAFEFIQNNENEIKAKLSSKLPEYKKSLLDAIEKLNIYSYSGEKLCDRNLCTGCMACVQACPKKCISIKQSSTGFSYPEINQKLCINCDICKNTCPVLNKYLDDYVKPQIYAGKNKDDYIRIKSSSGGIFYSLAKDVIDSGGVVFGAKFVDKYTIKHVKCDNIDELCYLLESKYIQSDVNTTFVQTAEYLKQGKMVLYCGTPCIIAGLKRFLKIDYDNLITIDFVCHGVPSPKSWKEYLEYLEKKYNSKVIKVSFRNKETGWKNYSLEFVFEDGKIIRERVSENIYMKSFLAHYNLRPSCFECSFKNMHRESEITLGDYWEVDKSHPELNDDKGISLIFVHTMKGKKILDKINNEIDTFFIDDENVISSSFSYLNSASKSCFQIPFEKKWLKNGFVYAIQSYTSNSLLEKVKRRYQKLVYWPWKK